MWERRKTVGSDFFGLPLSSSQTTTSALTRRPSRRQTVRSTATHCITPLSKTRCRPVPPLPHLPPRRPTIHTFLHHRKSSLRPPHRPHRTTHHRPLTLYIPSRPSSRPTLPLFTRQTTPTHSSRSPIRSRPLSAVSTSAPPRLLLLPSQSRSLPRPPTLLLSRQVTSQTSEEQRRSAGRGSIRPAPTLPLPPLLLTTPHRLSRPHRAITQEMFSKTQREMRKG
jgi:hypothetical protein